MLGDAFGVEAAPIPEREKYVQLFRDTTAALRGNPYALAVYVALREVVWSDGDVWYSTRADLAEIAGVGTTSFDKSVKTLVSLGLLEVIPRFVPKGWDRKDKSKIVSKRDKEHPEQLANVYRVWHHLPEDSGRGTPSRDAGDPLTGDMKAPHAKREQTYKHSPRNNLGGEATSRTPAESTPAPAPSDDPLDAIAIPEAGTPEEWCSADDPRCREHAGLPGWEVPACRACGSVREWFESRVTEKSKPERCPACVDNNGFIDMEDERGQPYVIRCDHRQAA